MRPASTTACRALAAFVLGAALAIPGSARAQAAADEPLPKLTVQRSEGAADCPDAQALADAVGKLTGRLPSLDTSDEGAQGAAGFDVEIRRSKDGYVGVVRPRSEASAERKMSDPGATCEGLAQALALTLAMQLDQPPPVPGARTAEGPGPGPPTARPPPIKPEPAPPPPAPPPRRSRGLALAGGVAGTLQVIDGAWWAQYVELEYRFGAAWSVAGGFVWVMPESIPHPNSLSTRLQDAHTDVSVLAATLRGCGFFLKTTATFAVWPPRVGGCVLGSVGRLQGQGIDFGDDNKTTNLLWLTLGGAAIVEQPVADLPILGPLAIVGRLGLTGPLLRHTLKVTLDDGSGVEVFKMAPLGAFLELGIRLSIL